MYQGYEPHKLDYDYVPDTKGRYLTLKRQRAFIIRGDQTIGHEAQHLRSLKGSGRSLAICFDIITFWVADCYGRKAVMRNPAAPPDEFCK